MTNPKRTLEQAILKTLAYADVFDFALTLEEIHRYLIQVPASCMQVSDALKGRFLESRIQGTPDGYFTLPGREGNAQIRSQRTQATKLLWPQACAYGEKIARLPFVRMVALTGALAVGNGVPDSDIDYLIVTEKGRLWTCRALLIAWMVRPAARRGLELCPNYFVSEDSLAFTDHNLYTAHELTQMVPLSGWQVYQRMRAQNPWSDHYLPNAQGPPRSAAPQVRTSNGASYRKLVETAIRMPPGNWFEGWEMRRKIKRFSEQTSAGEAMFGADYCKGHFEDHAQRTLNAYAARLEQVDLPPVAPEFSLDGGIR